MMGRRSPTRNGLEHDATCRWCRRYLASLQRAGITAYSKRLCTRRERREGKRDINDQLDDHRFGVDPD